MSQPTEEQLDGLLRMDPHELYDPAIVGIAYNAGARVVIYSKRKVIEIVNEDGLSYDEALEHFEFNIAGSGGEGYPMYLDDEEDE
jgi:hypothetical protein